MALINTTTTGVLGSTFFADGSGDLTVQQNGVTLNRITSAPAFSSYASATQVISNATFTKVVFDVERFDTNNNFASSTFTPTVEGYYQINHALYFAGSASGSTFVSLYKNGTLYAYLTRLLNNNSVNQLIASGCLAYCNGTTDYLEIYVYQNSGGSLTVGNAEANGCWFTGFLARAA